jgi:hypothetical protein
VAKRHSLLWGPLLLPAIAVRKPSFLRPAHVIGTNANRRWVLLEPIRKNDGLSKAAPASSTKEFHPRGPLFWKSMQQRKVANAQIFWQEDFRLRGAGQSYVYMSEWDRSVASPRARLCCKCSSAGTLKFNCPGNSDGPNRRAKRRG